MRHLGRGSACTACREGKRKAMRIGLLSFEMTASGGEQRQVLWLARELEERGHQVILYAYRYDPASCYPEVARHVEIRCVEQVAAGRLRPPSNALGVLSRAAQRYFLESRALARLVDSVDVLNPHGRPAHRAAALAKRRTGAPIIWTCNDLVSWEKPGHRARLPAAVQALASRLMCPLERGIAQQMDTIAVLDNSTGHILERAYERPTRLVRSGVDADALGERPVGRRRIRRQFGIPDEAFLVLWLGILEPFRRLEDLLEAVRLGREQGAPVRVLIVGRHDAAPGYARKLVSFVSEHQLAPLVQFLARGVPEDELADYYSASDVLVFPNDHQAGGLAPLEALACRRPVIVSRGSGVHEVLVDGETALLVPPRDPAALARAIRALMESPALAERIAQQGREFVARELSWGNYAAQMLELFEETLEAAGSRAAPAGVDARRGGWLRRKLAPSGQFGRMR